MTTDQEVDIFLEHFGKKGMKWGVRKAKATFGSENPNRKRNIKRAAVGVAAVGVGAIVAQRILSNKGNQPLRLVSQQKFTFQAFGPRGSIQAGKYVTNATLETAIENIARGL